MKKRYITNSPFYQKSKKEISLITGLRCPEGSRKLRFSDFVAQGSGKCVSLTHWPLLSPGNTPGTHFC